MRYKLWSMGYQRALEKLLKIYRGEIKTDHCPLCSVKSGNKGCQRCPWFVMTGKHCVRWLDKQCESLGLHSYDVTFRELKCSEFAGYGGLVGQIRKKRIDMITYWIYKWETENKLLIRDRMQEALDKTIKAYNALIKNPQKEVGNWKHYGDYAYCRFCKIAGVKDRYKVGLRCKDCPIVGTYDDSSHYCSGWTDSAASLAILLSEQTNDASSLINAAKDRLSQINSAAIKNGYKILGE